MEMLPAELLHNIFRLMAEDNEDSKNVLLGPRAVCKAFNNAIRPFVLKTVQLDFVRLADPRNHPSLEALDDAGDLCRALYVDVSIVRDEDEMERWSRLFGSAVKNDARISNFLEEFTHFCIGEEGFSEEVYRQLLTDVISRAPKLQKVRLNLPVLMLLGRGSSAATILLATFLACLHERPEESASIETLVLDHVSEHSIRSICRNPIDLKNARSVFGTLRNLAISIKRTSTHPIDTSSHFGKDFWLLLSYATQLETLVIKGCRIRKSYPSKRINLWNHEGALWTLHALPVEDLKTHQNLKCLELKNVALWPKQLLALLEQHKGSLRELYLVDVFLKISRVDDEENSVLWIGQGSSMEKPANASWIAESLRCMHGLKLDILRATDIGYDVFDPSIAETEVVEHFDLIDPTDRGRPFDRRFVEAALGTASPNLFQQPPSQEEHTPAQLPSNSIRTISIPLPDVTQPSDDYDVFEYRKTHPNTTSGWQYSIDGVFRNHSRGTEQKMKELIQITEHCFQIVSADVSRLRSVDALPPFTT